MDRDSIIERELISAFRAQNFERAKEILEQHPEIDVNAVSNQDGWRPLHFSVDYGDFEVSIYLMDVRKADPNVKNNYGFTPLMLAARRDHQNICLYLEENGADINLQENHGKTAFMYAAENGYLRTCQFFKEKGADVNTKDKYGGTACIYAATYGQLHICQFLETSGAELNVQDEGGETALHYAAKNNHPDVCQYLLDKGVNLNAKDSRGKTAFVEIYSRGQLNLMKRFCFAGVVLPEFDTLHFYDRTSEQARTAARDYIERQPLRQLILVLLSAKLVKDWGSDRPSRY
jgi:ankyrin repeat protein